MRSRPPVPHSRSVGGEVFTFLAYPRCRMRRLLLRLTRDHRRRCRYIGPRAVHFGQPSSSHHVNGEGRNVTDQEPRHRRVPP